MKFFELTRGISPLLISIPHAGTFIPDDLRATMTEMALETPDTDWHIPRLYDFAGAMGATMIAANYSRYVIDLNRPPDNAALYPGQAKVSLCPDETFEGQKIYKSGGGLDEAEVARRLKTYWQPYHDELAAQIARIKNEHGYVMLYDAHSIKGVLPRLFEGRLPDLNLGTAGGKSCAPDMGDIAFKTAKNGPYSAVLNGRFIGGYITRHYGDPAHDVHALQMELVRENYMDESNFEFLEDRAEKLRAVLTPVLQAIIDWGAKTYSPSRTTAAQGLNPKR